MIDQLLFKKDSDEITSSCNDLFVKPLEEMEKQTVLDQMRDWIHSLTSEELKEAMCFTFKSDDEDSNSNKQSSHEYDLLIEMLNNQCPPPTPIHPRALNFKTASDQPITDGRRCEEERILRSRFEIPRLFQFIKSYNKSAEQGTYSYDFENLGLPDEIAQLVKNERKKSHHEGQNNMDRKSHHTRPKTQKFDVLAKRFITPWGDVHSLGCTEEQQLADTQMLVGTMIQYGCKIRSSDPSCKFNFNPNINIGKIQINNSMDKSEVLRMLKVASRGRFLSMGLKQSNSDDDNHGIPFCAPWLDTNKEWFSLSKYLASRFEVALWDSFRSKNLSRNYLPQKSSIEIAWENKSKNDFNMILLQSLHQHLRSKVLLEMSNKGKSCDLCLHQLLLCNNTISESISSFGLCTNIETLTSIRIVDLHTSKDNFRLSLIQLIEDKLSQEIGDRLIESLPTETYQTKATKKPKKKKKNRKKKKKACTQTLKAINEASVHSSQETLHDDVSHFQYVGSLATNPPNEDKIKDVIMVLSIIDDIFVETFNKLGFKEDNDDDGFVTQLKGHHHTKRSVKLGNNDTKEDTQASAIKNRSNLPPDSLKKR